MYTPNKKDYVLTQGEIYAMLNGDLISGAHIQRLSGGTKGAVLKMAVSHRVAEVINMLPLRAQQSIVTISSEALALLSRGAEEVTTDDGKTFLLHDPENPQFPEIAGFAHAFVVALNERKYL